MPYFKTIYVDTQEDMDAVDNVLFGLGIDCDQDWEEEKDEDEEDPS